jgi:hypothetical protein
MRAVLIAAASLVALAVVVIGIGLMMPREHSATSEITLRQPIDSIYAVLRDIGGMPRWWSDLTVSERVGGVDQERWRQEAGGFAMQLDVAGDTPPTGFTTKIVEEQGAPFGGMWTYRLTPAANGTLVSVTEDGWVGPPHFRVISRVMGHHRTIDGMLTALGRKYGEEVKPVHR